MAETTINAVADYMIRFAHEHGILLTNLHLRNNGKILRQLLIYVNSIALPSSRAKVGPNLATFLN